MSAELYDPRRPCPTCHVNHSLDQWRPELDEDWCYRPVRVERKCHSCGFEWWERVSQWKWADGA